MERNDIHAMKDFEDENARLKHIVGNLTLEIDAVKNVLQKKYGGLTIREKRKKTEPRPTKKGIHLDAFFVR